MQRAPGCCARHTSEFAVKTGLRGILTTLPAETERIETRFMIMLDCGRSNVRVLCKACCFVMCHRFVAAAENAGRGFKTYESTPTKQTPGAAKTACNTKYYCIFLGGGQQAELLPQVSSRTPPQAWPQTRHHPNECPFTSHACVCRLFAEPNTCELNWAWSSAHSGCNAPPGLFWGSAGPPARRKAHDCCHLRLS